MKEYIEIRTLPITFSVGGYMYQTIEVEDNCPYTNEEIVRMMNEGKIEIDDEDEELVEISSHGNKLIGKIVYIENNRKYNDFQLTIEE